LLPLICLVIKYKARVGGRCRLFQTLAVAASGTLSGRSADWPEGSTDESVVPL